jgi:hypothetical protein
MGWGRMLLLGNWGQQMDIEDQKLEIEELRRQLAAGSGTTNMTADTRLVRLEKENGELRLYIAALIRYLGHKGLLRSSEFNKLVETIDIEDGSTDGSYRGKIVKD